MKGFYVIQDFEKAILARHWSRKSLDVHILTNLTFLVSWPPSGGCGGARVIVRAVSRPALSLLWSCPAADWSTQLILTSDWWAGRSFVTVVVLLLAC